MTIGAGEGGQRRGRYGMLEISINMILDCLSAYRPVRLFPSTEDLFFNGLRLYERGQSDLSSENIYMCASGELTDEAVGSGCCFLCIHKVAPAMRRRLEGKRFVLLEDAGITLADMFNHVQSLFTDLREWHQNMHISLIQNDDAQELLDLSEGAIGNPIVLVDLSFKLLAYTRHIKTDDEIYNALISRGYHTKQVIERLTKNRQVDSIKKASVIDIEFPLPQMTRYQTMTKTFYTNGVPYAYLRMICSNHAPSKSLEERFSLLSESVELYLHKRYSVSSINKYMYEYILVELIEKKVKEEEIDERIRCVGLRRNSEYQLLKILFEDEANTSLSYVLEQLLVIFPEARPFIYGSYIVVLMNYESKYQDVEARRQSQFELLREFLDYHRAHCGMSTVFRSLPSVSDAYVQTTVAIEIGHALQKKGVTVVDTGDGRIFDYRDYYIYHLLTACAGQVRLNSLCDGQLLAIREQDEQKGTEYAKLLYTYLMNECRPTDTARVLHMHRNNVIYHVERLSDQLGVDLGDPETRLRLLLSYKAMDLM